MRVIKAIIFDCFGVLAGSAYKAIYQNSGGDLEKNGEFIKQALHDSNTGVISNVELDRKVAERLGKDPKDWQQIVTDKELPNEALLEYVKELKKKYKTAILSNAYIGTLEAKFSPEQLALFDVRVVSAEVGMLKPQPEIYKYVAKKLKVNPEECVFTDDLMPYVEAAKEVGMQGILYQDIEQFKRELDKILSHS